MEKFIESLINQSSRGLCYYFRTVDSILVENLSVVVRVLFHSIQIFRALFQNNCFKDYNGMPLLIAINLFANCKEP